MSVIEKEEKREGRVEEIRCGGGGGKDEDDREAKDTRDPAFSCILQN